MTVEDWVRVGTPTLVFILGALIKSWVGGLKEAIRDLTLELKGALKEVAALQTQHAVTESRLSRLEADMGALWGRVGRIINDKIEAKLDDRKTGGGS